MRRRGLKTGKTQRSGLTVLFFLTTDELKNHIPLSFDLLRASYPESSRYYSKAGMHTQVCLISFSLVNTTCRIAHEKCYKTISYKMTFVRGSESSVVDDVNFQIVALAKAQAWTKGGLGFSAFPIIGFYTHIYKVLIMISFIRD